MVGFLSAQICKYAKKRKDSQKFRLSLRTYFAVTFFTSFKQYSRRAIPLFLP